MAKPWIVAFHQSLTAPQGPGGTSRSSHDDPDEELHVLIVGDSREQVCLSLMILASISSNCCSLIQVDKAVERIKPLLAPVADEQNEWKQKQMRELAIINGTSHLGCASLLAFMQRVSGTLKLDHHCIICGASGHQQFDCPQRSSKWNCEDYDQ